MLERGVRHNPRLPWHSGSFELACKRFLNPFRCIQKDDYIKPTILLVKERLQGSSCDYVIFRIRKANRLAARLEKRITLVQRNNQRIAAAVAPFRYS